MGDFVGRGIWTLTQEGEWALTLESARRHAKTPEERARIPAPPGPTFATFSKGEALATIMVS